MVSPMIATRALDASDMAAVERVMGRAFDAVFGEAWTPAQCLATFALPGYAWLGAHSAAGGAIAGFALFRSIAGESELLLLAVDPSNRRQGVGAALIAGWLDACRAGGATRCFLEVRADNPAQNLYVCSGFDPVARRTNYYRGGDGLLRDAITMQYRAPN